MVLSRPVRQGSLVLGAALLVTACGGNDDPPAPLELDRPATSGAATAAADPREEIDATIEGYYAALIGVNQQRRVTPDLRAVATPERASALLETYRDNLFSKGLQFVGRFTAEIESVSADGDVATADVCVDGREAFVVERGAKVQPSDSGQLRVPSILTLITTPGGWKVDAVDIRGDERC